MPPKKPLRVRIGVVLTDTQLVRRVLAGDTALFEVLVHRNSQRIYRAARAILRNDAEAADVVQESHLRAYRNLKQFAGRAKYSTWLTKIAVYEARARARRSRTRGELGDAKTWKETRNEPASDQDPEKSLMAREVKTILEAAIDALPDLYRTVFVMREVEEMSTAETAQCLNLSQDAVKTRLRRARVLLRKKLQASVGSKGPDAFLFAGRRCQRMWEEKILPAIKLSARPGARPSRQSH